MMIMVLFRVGLQQASSISDMWLKGRKCSEWHFSPTSAKGNVGTVIQSMWRKISARKWSPLSLASNGETFHRLSTAGKAPRPLLLIGSGIICWAGVVRFLYKIGRLSKILKIRICFPCGGRFCPKVIPLGAFWQYSGTKRNTREPFHKHKVGLLGTNVHHVGCRGKMKRYFSSLLCLLDDRFILFCF